MSYQPTDTTKTEYEDPQLAEQRRLTLTLERLERAVLNLDTRLKQYQQNIQEQKTYLWESKADMDHVEKISTRQSIEQMLTTGETVLAQRERLLKLTASPYFGRIDFAETTRDETTTFYIGVSHFYDEVEKTHLIHDWRAPVAGLFYDYETGPAAYQSPAGRVDGEIRRKRQFRIRDGEMEMMLESALHIVDDVLQEELARASDDGMRNIVATIQRDQNAIIRNEEAPTLVIQGVAGSGKTSIALHRIAFLLYRFKETLSSKDILIISPNRVFADYIANVLPELGEEMIAEIGMEHLADTLLDGKIPFQTFFEQTAHLLETDDAQAKQRIAEKSTSRFLKNLGAYAEHVEATRFSAEDLTVAGRPVPAWFIEKHFRRCRGMAPAQRLTEVVKAVEVNMGIYYNIDLGKEDRQTLRAALKAMHRSATIRDIYKDFYHWLGRPELLVAAKGRKLEYADVFPLLYLKLRLEKIEHPYAAVKHLLIDEMQDYTPVQYAVLAKLFPCRKTILGDVAQSVNPYSASQLDDIQRAFADATLMTLTKSYRSTRQIMDFAQKIRFNPDLVSVRRDGALPRVQECRSKREELSALVGHVQDFQASDHRSLAIICKTQKQAQKIAVALEKARLENHLLDPASSTFSSGVIVCTAHLAKGLEFDRVLIPDVSATNYRTDMDRNLLYVACTRAMHVLLLTCTGEPSTLLSTVVTNPN